MDDLALVRSLGEDVVNLAIGEPEFLSNIISQVGLDRLPLAKSAGPYPHLGGNENLLKELAKRYPDKHIVVTNGAKQALFAAVHALKETNISISENGKISGNVQIPYEYLSVLNTAYWPTFKTLASLNGLKFSNTDGRLLADAISVLASPNNPDGVILGEVKVHIWDACYASPIYGFNASSPIPQARITVYSAAKLFGQAGLRVGWLVTEDKRLADLAAQYVEAMTSGVSSVSQDIVAQLLHIPDNDSVFKDAHNVLLLNGMKFWEILGPLCYLIDGLPERCTGMFAFFEPIDKVQFKKALQKANTVLLDGLTCGIPGWYRMNLGLKTDNFEKAILHIAECYEGPTNGG